MVSASIKGFRIRAGSCSSLKPYQDNLYESTAEAYDVILRHRCKGSRPEMVAELDTGDELQVDYGYDMDVGKHRFELQNEEEEVIGEDPKVGDAFTKIEMGVESCGTIDYSDGVRIYDSMGREVVMWSPEELGNKMNREASEEAIKLTKKCRVNELKKIIRWKE